MLAPLGPELGGPGDGGLLSPGVSPAATPSGAHGPAEVDTEYEEDAQDDGPPSAAQAPPTEVEDEELEASIGESTYAPSTNDPGPQDYQVPAANKEVWKAFGCNTEAGRALRSLYKSGSQRDAASMVAYPRLKSPSQRWEPKPKDRGACPQRAPVRVPRARQPTPDRDDPRNWRVGVPLRRPAHEIQAEMEAQRPQIPDLPKGRDQSVEKQQLQSRFQFCGGRAMPKGAMGYVENAALPKAGPSVRSQLQDRKKKDDNGMDAEQREIFEELMLAIKRKQERLKEIESAERGDDPNKPSKARTARNKEALELRNDIDRCMKDIDKLMELTDS